MQGIKRDTVCEVCGHDTPKDGAGHLYAENCRLTRIVRLMEACGITVDEVAGCLVWRGCKHYPPDWVMRETFRPIPD